jgi:predicted  nucleic acid-binding Zn-ribbon protein
VSIENQVPLLRNLAALDGVLARLEAELEQERAKNAARRQQKTELSDRVAGLEAAVREMERTKSELTQELRQVAIQVDKAREKLTRVRNEKEANAATRELEELRRIHREREKEIEKLSGLIEEARADVEKATTARDTVLAELGETAEAEKTKIEALEEEIRERQKEREQSVQGIDRQTLRRYDAVRARRGSGLAEVVEGTCVACHIAVSPMLFQQITRQQEFHACPSCHRILYYLPNRSKEAPSSAAKGQAEEA